MIDELEWLSAGTYTVRADNHMFYIRSSEEDNLSTTNPGIRTDVRLEDARATFRSASRLVIRTGISNGPVTVQITSDERLLPTNMDAWDEYSSASFHLFPGQITMGSDEDQSVVLGINPATGNQPTQLHAAVFATERSAAYDTVVYDAVETYLIILATQPFARETKNQLLENIGPLIL